MGTALRLVKGSALTHQELDNRLAETVTAATHGFSVGDFLYRASDSTWKLAVASAQETIADGIVVGVLDVNTFSVAAQASLVDWTHGLGADGLDVYLSQSVAGTGTTTPPVAGIAQRLGKIATSTLFLFRAEPGGAPEFAQATHGFSVGDVVRRSSAAAHAAAQADTDVNIGVGLALVVNVRDAGTYTVLRAGAPGLVTIAAHGFGSFGTKLYLSRTVAGAITATEPDPGWRIYLGFVLDVNSIHWEPGWVRF